jgi:hypothetical protein
VPPVLAKIISPALQAVVDLAKCPKVEEDNLIVA